MSQADESQQLVILCHKLQQAGLQPSVGLLRSKAPFKVSVTQAIDAVKRFNASNQAPQSPKTEDGEDRITTLEKRIASMEAAIGILEKRLAQLTDEKP